MRKNKFNTNEESESTNLEEKWITDDFKEGQLAVDVHQDSKNIVIKSTIAGVKPEDLSISLNNDMLTIKGKRGEDKVLKGDDYLIKECYWGSFSRSIILPTDVDDKKIDAELENGVLTITLKKISKQKEVEIKVKD